MHNIRFEPYETLEKNGVNTDVDDVAPKSAHDVPQPRATIGKPDFSNYNKVYEGYISSVKGGTAEKLEALYEQFNIQRPEDFKVHSLSVSDVVVLDNKAYYVDTVGFKPLEQFVPFRQQITLKYFRFLPIICIGIFLAFFKNKEVLL